MVHAVWPKNTMLQLVLHGRGALQDIVNVLNYEVTAAREALLITDALAITQAETLLDDWRTNVMPTWLLMVSNFYTLPRLTCQVVERSGLYEHRLTTVDKTYSTAITGGIANQPDDYETAAVIRWKSTVAGKHHRGRTYVSALPQDNVAEGLISAGQKTLCETFADLMLSRYGVGTTNAGGSQFTIYSRPFDDNYYATGRGAAKHIVHQTDYAGDSTLVTARVVDTVVRAQRRRQIGVGS